MALPVIYGGLMAIRIPAESGPAGRADTVGLGGQYGTPGLGGTRFE